MKNLLYLIVAVLLTACGGGTGNYVPSCAGTAEGCTKHIPTGNRGDSDKHIPYTGRGDSSHEPSDDRGDDSERNPDTDRGGKESHKPSNDRGDSSTWVPSSGRGDSTSHTPKDRDYTSHTPTDGRGNNSSSSSRTAGKRMNISVKDETILVLLNQQDFETLPANIDYNSVGQELGLSYSDFGTYTFKDSEKVAVNNTFITIDNEHKIEIAEISQDVHFQGRAIGRAESKGSEVGLDGLAKLDFDKSTGTSTLGAKFDNWYDIEVQDNKDGTIKFSNYKNQDGLVKLGSDQTEFTGAEMQVNYYGKNVGKPTEANGSVSFQESPSGVKMDVVFGVK